MATIQDCVYFGPIVKEDGTYYFKKETTTKVHSGSLEKIVNGVSSSVAFYDQGRGFNYNIQSGLHLEGKKGIVTFFSSTLTKDFRIEFNKCSNFCNVFQKITNEIIFGTKVIGLRQCVIFKQCIIDLTKMPDWGKKVLEEWNFITIHKSLQSLQLPTEIQHQTILFLLGSKDLVILATRLEILYNGTNALAVPGEIPQ